MSFTMKCALTLAIALAWPSLSGAAEPLPPHLTGTWSTGKLPHAEGGKQVDLYLKEDGFGVLLGSRYAQATGTAAAPSHPDQFLAMAIEATLEGDTLTTRPVVPDNRHSAEAASKTLVCHVAARGPALACADPQGVVIDMQRQSDTITADVATMLGILGEQGKRTQPPHTGANDGLPHAAVEQ
ncbi:MULTISPECIES: hypothetical protein [unclassified Massilia]|uniref:hypothetical protein n=1 Tax=unclassified Massilia TaxID=2609279 RepID=UPI00177B2F23|nr:MULTISPECIES: hypothetical protein [unclassified Massilia]MBD8528627.1 hypothetical protein [Massilia sp. CFBP 13647]MBD8671750.1 hypothetical protein [Massilia sp. CFBP 13721]